MISKILTANGKEFTGRLCSTRARDASVDHEFDKLCGELDIEHPLTKPRSTQTNGMVERFNGCIADMLKTNCISGEDLEKTIMRYVGLYNAQLPQSALTSKTPVQAMKNWYKSNPELFSKRPGNHQGCDS